MVDHDNLLEIPQEILENMTFEDFQQGCHQVLSMSDKEIKSSFAGKDPRAGDAIREKYRELSEKVTREDFATRKLRCLKAKGNAMVKQQKYADALNSYKKAVDQLPMMGDKTEESALDLNLSLVYLKLKQYPKAIEAADHVSLLSTTRIAVGEGPVQHEGKLQGSHGV